MSAARKPLTDEMRRILDAVAEGRMRFLKATGRWIIDGEDRPGRRDRELLMKRGYVTWVTSSGGPAYTYVLTALGRAARGETE